MKTIKLSTASRTLAEYAADLTDEIVLLTTGNRAVAALVRQRSTLTGRLTSAYSRPTRVEGS